MEVFKVLLVVLLIVLVMVLLLSLMCYFKAFYSPYKNQNDDFVLFPLPAYQKMKDRLYEYIKSARDIPYEEVEITSYDGTKLHAYYYHTSDDAVLDICFHGYRGTPLKDFSGGVKAFLKLGHNVLLVHQRAHGKSSGHTISFGIKESKDCLYWINYAIKRFGPKQDIILGGISMGASTVLLASQYQLPSNVKGIIADSPFTSPKDIIKKVCENDMHLPVFIVYPFIFLGAFIYGGFNLNDGDIKKALIHNNLKILIIHGKNDSYVPCSMSKLIADKDPNVDIEIFEGAEHGLSFVVDQPKYEKIVQEFVNKMCKK